MSKIIEMAESLDEFIMLEDGFVYYWPVASKGAISAQDLRIIAAELDRRNSAWEKDIEEYFDNMHEKDGK